jgi:hypothetical protein
MNKYYITLFSFTLLFFFSGSTNAQNHFYWNEISQVNVQSTGERIITPEKFKVFTLNIPEIRNILNTAPQEKNIQVKNSNVILSLPLPGGGFGRFKIVESPIMEKGLADKFPEIKTYMGQGIDDPYATVRFDLTPLGFHAMIMTASDMIFIDPYAKGDTYNYITYYKKDYKPINKKFSCKVIDDNKTNYNPQTKNIFFAEGQLRTYRVAIGATGEYTAYFGGTVSQGLAAIVVSLNRVDGVYEREVSVRMILVANNNLIVFTNASTDPYTNNDGEAMLGQNQVTCDNIIGSANYDIGHVFSTGGGGVAYLGCVCEAGMKAQGVTGSSAPVGDPYDIDYVAHEMGHQFGGNHTFNCVTESCGGGNREAGAAYEPGSGSTIMAYAGICYPNDLQNNSDAYFVLKSLLEIASYTTYGNGNSCAQITTTGNHNPVVTVGAGGNTIPKSTPFSLTGSAIDADNDSLVYCWEEYDLGPAGNWNNPSGNAPIFRSFAPTTSGTRIFPKLTYLLSNTQHIGEILPTYARDLNFYLIARDNKPGGGGTGYSSILSLSVTDNAGPFLVTSPNTAVTWNANLPQTVTWDVANTNLSPVNCTNVNIKLSTDGGYTFPIILISNTSNDGSEAVNLSMVQTSTARIEVEAVGNVFFDISNTNFTISTVSGIRNLESPPVDFKLLQNYPNPFNPSTMISFSISKKADVNLSVYDVTGKIVAKLIDNEIMTEGSYSYEFDGSTLASGIYFYKLNAGNFEETRKMVLMK